MRDGYFAEHSNGTDHRFQPSPRVLGPLFAERVPTPPQFCAALLIDGGLTLG
jgi:hypothetical protein